MGGRCNVGSTFGAAIGRGAEVVAAHGTSVSWDTVGYPLYAVQTACPRLGLCRSCPRPRTLTNLTDQAIHLFSGFALLSERSAVVLSYEIYSPPSHGEISHGRQNKGYDQGAPMPPGRSLAVLNRVERWLTHRSHLIARARCEPPTLSNLCSLRSLSREEHLRLQ
jgi:hypothetical protein